jgi:vancomycin resistance protein YoaR
MTTTRERLTTPQKRLLAAAAVVAALLVVGYLLLALGSGTTARSGTTVGGVDISGMTQEEAAAAVEEGLGPVAEKRLRVRALDDTFRVQPADAGLGLDAAASVAPAFGRTWNPIALVTSLFGSEALPAVPAVDEDRLAAEVAAIADSVDRPAVEPSLEFRRGAAVVTPGTPGRVLDREATAAALTAAVLQPRAPIDAVVLDVEPTVTQESIDEAVALAEEAAAAPVTVTADTVTAQIPGRAVGRALSFSVEDGRFVPELDGAVLHSAIADALAPVEVQGRDATFRIKNGKPKVVKSKVGRGVGDDELAAAVEKVIALPASERRVTVPVGTREPELTTEEAQALGVKERLSSFTQQYPYAPYRSQNIGQAAERINGTLLMPGETFSLNDTILERTKENGYTEGYVVGEGGVFQEALGGGVSASATTTWTAAFFAGMERVQTIAHSIYISRYQPGLEATVAWGIFDMKFRNDTSNAVFITAGTTPTSMTVSFWGTKEYDEIKAEFGPRRDIVPFEKIYDDSPECEGQNGVDGFTITVDRVFYKNGEEVRREPITTRYKPAPDVTCGKDPKDKKPKKNRPGAEAPANPSGDGEPAAEPSERPSREPKPSESTPADDDVFTNE